MADPTALSPVVVATQQFIDYAMILVGIITAYYGIRFLATFFADEEGEWEEKGQSIKAAVQERMGESRIRDEIARERRLLDQALSFILKIERAAEKLQDLNLSNRTSSAANAANNEMSHIKSHLGSLKRTVRAYKHHARREDKPFARDLNAHVDHMVEGYERVHNDLKLHVHDSEDEWNQKATAIKALAEAMITQCGVLHNEINEHLGRRIEEIRGAAAERRARGSERAGHQARRRATEQARRGAEAAEGQLAARRRARLRRR